MEVGLVADTDDLEIAGLVVQSACPYKCQMICIFCAIPFAGTPFGPQCEDLRNGVHVLVCTPGRLLDHVRRQSAVSRLGKSGHRHK